MIEEQLQLTILAALEARELALLNWGVVDAGSSALEFENLLLGLATEHTELAVEPAAEVARTMTSSGLILKYTVDGENFYRSRMAETVRLLVKLRQIFRGQDWRLGRRLVADYRIIARERIYPRRNVGPSAFVERVAGESGERRIALARALISADTSDALTLAKFQVDASCQILGHLDRRYESATLVSAGTGSGKTLAFYLPSLLFVGDSVARDGGRWTRGVALYPRKELLKDQFTAVYSMARRLDKELLARGHRKVILGAWYQATPRDAMVDPPGWDRTASGFVCPYLRCVLCDGRVIWTHADRRKGIERLECDKPACDFTADEGAVSLTRRSLRKSPPDILFTTTESLNRNMGSSTTKHVFGIGHKTARFCLLDEAHTYEGTHGAQVAYLLRRWRRALANRVVFVGLSATLTDGSRFLSDLCGVPLWHTTSIDSTHDDTVTGGMEYLLALRHDPSAWTSPLSTTIQTAMLLARMLDPISQRSNTSVFGQRIFAFTDRLDSVNRLYWDTLDAEGWFRPGRPIARYQPRSLATIRTPVGASADQKRAGQVWDMAQSLGHNIAGDEQLVVGRTTSQDAGVDVNAQIVMATAALEVGFDDDRVGGVIQHKAPHDAARFLQRKGRAGRRQEMRPWTVVVLSDYGRDRLAFQAYDRLFSPVLDPQNLPLRNRYVQRMQASYATLDYLCGVTNAAGWYALNRPREKLKSQLVEQVTKLLEDGAEADRLREYLSDCMQLSGDEVDVILWEPPRPILLGLLPRFLTDLCYESDLPAGADSPVPRYAPGSLFSDLLLPEVQIAAEPARNRGEALVDALPVDFVLREFCPGNVSRRYGVTDREERHWLPVPGSALTTGVLDLGTLGDLDLQEDGFTNGGEDDRSALYRPVSVRLRLAPFEKADSDTGIPFWEVEVLPKSEGSTASGLPGSDPWSSVLTAVTPHLHRHGSEVEVTRYVRKAEVTTREQSRTSVAVVGFVDTSGDDVRSAALGYRLDTDAVGIQHRVPDKHEMKEIVCSSPTRLRNSRAEYLLHLVRATKDLPPNVSRFHRDTLRTATLIAMATPGPKRLPPLGSDDLVAVLDVMYERPTNGVRAQTHQQLVDLVGDHSIVEALNSCVSSVLGELTEDWLRWEQERISAAISGSFLSASQTLCRDVDIEDLSVDVVAPGEIWISENTPGGGGVIERIVDAYLDDPARFTYLMSKSLLDSDYERVDRELTQTLVAANHEESVKSAFSTVRNALAGGGLSAATEAFDDLRRTLAAVGVWLNRESIVAISTRLVVAGSSSVLDRLLLEQLEAWQKAEERLGVELDSRVAGSLLVRTHIGSLQEMAQGELDFTNDARRYLFLAALLWPRSGDLREVGLHVPNRFAAVPTPNRSTLRALLKVAPSVSVDAIAGPEDMVKTAAIAVGKGGRLTLSASHDHRIELKRALIALAASSIDVGTLLGHARVVGANFDSDGLNVDIEIPEAT